MIDQLGAAGFEVPCEPDVVISQTVLPVTHNDRSAKTEPAPEPGSPLSFDSPATIQQSQTRNQQHERWNFQK